MKHRFADDVNINLNIEFEFNAIDVQDVIDTARDAVVKIIVVATVASVVKSIFK